MEQSDLKLIPLRCPECGGEINSKEEDRVYFCYVCGIGFEIVRNKFKKVNVIYAKPKSEFKSKIYYYLPFWQISTTISIKKQYSLNYEDIPEELLKVDNFSKLLTGLFKEKDARKKMMFFVPAFGITNRYQLMDEPGFQFTVDPPELEKGTPKDMVGAEYTIRDALDLAKVMFLSIQAHSRIEILGADIDFEFHKYRIAGIPFYEDGALLIGGIKGFRIFKDALKNWDEIKEQLNRRHN